MIDAAIVLIEDNENDEFLALRALKAGGVATPVMVLRDGQEAVEYLLGAGSEGRPLPRLILLDLKLPKIDGLEVLRRLRARPRTALVPVVILSSSREAPDRQRSYSLGCNSYVHKPVDYEEFARAVGAVGQYWLTINEPSSP